ncbi:MAG: YceI family protein [Mucilaginibacter polytrichastri]|nr:YceI family protein [Mucilaginibacter polytrichastri]
MAQYTIDPAHSEVTFKIRHLMISNVSGKFGTFSGSATAGENFADADISFEADVNSIDTGNAQRDEHLKSGDFFDTAAYPTLSFKSTSFAQKSGADYTLTGDLTLHGVTKPVTLDVEYAGEMQDFYGNTKSGFEVKGKISRKEFGLEWSGVTEAGGVVLGDDVKLEANIQLTKQA